MSRETAHRPQDHRNRGRAMLRDLQNERAARTKTRSAGRTPYFVDHPSFRTPEADREYGVAATPPDDGAYRQAHMPDEVTRALARRMHYAAFRWREATTPKAAGRW